METGRKTQKILLITGNHCGGAEKVTINFGRQLSKLGYEIKIVIIGKDSLELNDYLGSDLNVAYLPIRKMKYSFFQLKTLIKNEKPDAVFTSLLGISLPLLIIKALNPRGLKVVIRHSFNPQRYNKLSFFSISIILLYPFADKVIAQTQEMKENIAIWYGIKKNVIVIYNPINTEQIDLLSKEPNPYKDGGIINFLAIGSIRFEKGFDTLIDAFELYNQKFRNAHLFIVGKMFNDKYYLNLLKKVRDKNLDSIVHFEGFSSNPYKYLANCDCFILSSRTEGLPNVLLEALYLEKPVVATSCIPFIKQVITDNHNGFTVKVDHPREMGLAMEKAIHLKTTPFQPLTMSSNKIETVFL